MALEIKLNEKVKVEVDGEVKTGYIGEIHQDRQNGIWMPPHGVRVTSAPYNKGEFLAYRDPKELKAD